MSEERSRPKDLKMRQSEFLANQMKSDRASLINSKRVFFLKQLSEQQAESRQTSFYQNVPNKDEIVALIRQTAEQPPQPELLRQFIAEMKSDNMVAITRGLVSVRVLIAHNIPTIAQSLISYDGLTPLMEFMQDFMHPHLQEESSWIISNISSGSSDDTHALLNKGVVQVLQKVLKCSFEDVIKNVLGTIGNISADCPVCRNAVYNSGMLPAVQALPSKFPDPSIAQKITWIVSNLLRLKPESEPYSEQTVDLIKKLLREFVEATEFDVLNDCLFGLSRHVTAKIADLYMNVDFLVKLRRFHEELMGRSLNSNVSLISSVHEIISGLSLCQDQYILELMKIGFLKNLHIVICCKKQAFVIDALVILSNFVVGNDSQVSAVLAEPGLVDKVMTLISTGTPKVQKNAVWVICNMCGTSSLENVTSLMSFGLMETFSHKLSLSEDPVTLNNIVEALSRLAEFFERTSPAGNNQFIDMIQDNGIAFKLEELQSHKSENVYGKVLAFMERYFEVE